MTKQKEDRKKESLSKHPHWHGHLPKAFPYRYRGTPDSILLLANFLTVRMGTEYQNWETVPELYHAVTGHPRWREEWLDLWLSKDAAEFLVGRDLVPREEIEETIR